MTMLSESKTVNRAIGWSGLVGGIVCLCASVYIYQKPFSSPDKAAINRAAMTRCSDSMKDMGFTVSVDSSKSMMSAVLYGTDSHEGKLARASYVIAQCDKYSLASFCMGQNCRAQDGQMVTGVTFALNTELKFAE